MKHQIRLKFMGLWIGLLIFFLYLVSFCGRIYVESFEELPFWVAIGTLIAMFLGALLAVLFNKQMKLSTHFLLSVICLAACFLTFSNIVVSGNHLNILDQIRSIGFPSSDIPNTLDSHSRGLWEFWLDMEITPEQYINEGILSGARLFQSCYILCSLSIMMWVYSIIHWLKRRKA